MTLERKEVMDLVVRMLDAMSNYDPTLKHFSAIRDRILGDPPVEPHVIIALNRANYEYLSNEGGRVLPQEDSLQEEAVQSLPHAEEMGDRLHYLGIMPDENLAYAIVLWAAAMSCSRSGLTPWNHLYDLIREESAGMPEEQDETNETGAA